MALHRFGYVVGRDSRLAGLAKSRLLIPAILLLAACIFAAARTRDVEPAYILDVEEEIKPVSADGFGIPHKDARFLSNLDGELVAGTLSEAAAPKACIHDSLTAGYKAQGHTLSNIINSFESRAINRLFDAARQWQPTDLQSGGGRAQGAAGPDIRERGKLRGGDDPAARRSGIFFHPRESHHMVQSGLAGSYFR